MFFNLFWSVFSKFLYTLLELIINFSFSLNEVFFNEFFISFNGHDVLQYTQFLFQLSQFTQIAFWLVPSGRSAFLLFVESDVVWVNLSVVGGQFSPSLLYSIETLILTPFLTLFLSLFQNLIELLSIIFNFLWSVLGFLIFFIMVLVLSPMWLLWLCILMICSSVRLLGLSSHVSEAHYLFCWQQWTHHRLILAILIQNK